MTKKDAQLFSSLMFYTFTLVLVSFVFVFPIMAYFKCSSFTILMTLLFIGFALPSVMMVMLQKCYWLISSRVSAIFHKYSLPLIRQEESHKIIYNLQMKIFNPLRTTLLVIIICYLTLKLVSGSSFRLFSTFFEILLQLACWSIAMLMTIDGIFVYSIYLFDIAIQLSGYKKPKRLQKVNLKTIYINLKSILTEKSTYIPKRLSTEEPSLSEKTFSLKSFVIETNIKFNRRLHFMKNSIIKMIRYFPITFIALICLISICSAAEAPMYDMAEGLENIVSHKEVQVTSHTGWFYEQLSEMEKVIYDGLADNREQLMDGKEVSISFADSNLRTKENEDIFKSLIITAKRAYLADHPAEKIWMDNCKLFLRSRNGFLQMIVRPQGEFDTREASETFEQIADAFIQTLSGTDREKLEAIHNWLISNVQYDLTADNNGNAYGAIVEGRSVCSGFAYSFKYLADKAGLNVVYVQGYYYNSSTDTYGYHAWNMAEIDGEWLLIDVTFDNSLKNFSLFSWQDSGAHHPDPLFTYPS